MCSMAVGHHDSRAVRELDDEGRWVALVACPGALLTLGTCFGEPYAIFPRLGPLVEWVNSHPIYPPPQRYIKCGRILILHASFCQSTRFLALHPFG